LSGPRLRTQAPKLRTTRPRNRKSYRLCTLQGVATEGPPQFPQPRLNYAMQDRPDQEAPAKQG